MMFTFESIGDEIANLSAKPKMGEVPPKQDKDKKRNVCVCVCVCVFGSLCCTAKIGTKL